MSGSIEVLHAKKLLVMLHIVQRTQGIPSPDSFQIHFISFYLYFL
jgi:hypothetical protein